MTRSRHARSYVRQLTLASAFAVVVAGCAATAAPGSSQLPVSSAGPEAVVIAQSEVISMTTAFSDERFRIYIRQPTRPAPAEGYPLIIMTDGDLYFGLAAHYLNAHAAIGNLPEAIIVGVGYAQEENATTSARSRTLTPRVDAQFLPEHARPYAAALGGSENFRRFLLEELKPYLYQRFDNINRQCETLFGHSFGGLFTLETMYASPLSFDYYIAASPSIQWGNRIITQAEAPFIERMTGEDAIVHLWIGASDREDPITTEVRDLDVRLRGSPLYGRRQFDIETVVLSGESHASFGAVGSIRAARIGSQCTLR
jgi:uncharacterized protein